jgi:hypothetical protein
VPAESPLLPMHVWDAWPELVPTGMILTLTKSLSQNSRRRQNGVFSLNKEKRNKLKIPGTPSASSFFLCLPLFEHAVHAFMYQRRWQATDDFSNPLFHFGSTDLLADGRTRILDCHFKQGENRKRNMCLLGAIWRAARQGGEKGAGKARRKQRQRRLRERWRSVTTNETQQDLQDVFRFCHVCFEEAFAFS